ncbi:hypothetical protein ACR2V4_27345, partial [Klebsiella pneumoniae]
LSFFPFCKKFKILNITVKHIQTLSLSVSLLRFWGRRTRIAVKEAEQRKREHRIELSAAIQPPKSLVSW